MEAQFDAMEGRLEELTVASAQPDIMADVPRWQGILKEIDFPADAIIGGIIRGGDTFIAVGHTRIEPYDRVAVFALPDAVKDVDKLFR